MTITELKNKSRKEVPSPFTGMTYTIRSVSQIEFSRVQLEGILPADKPADTEKEFNARVAASALRHVTLMQWALERAVVNPRVNYGPEDKVGDGEVHASWIAQDEAFLYSEILKHSGLDDEAQAALQDFLKNPKGSETTMPSPGSTDASLATSSVSGPSN